MTRDGRSTRTRSWRIAKRHEDSAPPTPRNDADVTVALEGITVEGSRELLVEVQHHLAVDDADLAELFGVAAPAIEAWRRRGVPPRRGERLRRIHETVDALRSHGRERSVAELARVPVAEDGDASILDLLAANAGMAQLEAAVEAVQTRD